MTEMGRCRDCKWWIRLDDEPRWGICASFSQGGDLADMIQVPAPSEDSPEELYTREDFGCVGFSVSQL